MMRLAPSRLSLFLSSALLGFVLANCHHKTGTFDPNKFKEINRGDYAYKKVNDGEYVVAAVDHQSLEKALDEIGCGKKFICLVEKDGEYFSVQQRERQ